VGANVTAYTDSGLSAGTTLCYRVRAYNSAGNSAYTPEACKTTSSATSSTSASLVASPINIPVGGTITATWSGIGLSTSSDWIGLYVPGAANNSLIQWMYVSCSKSTGSPKASGSCPFAISASVAAGTYELRLFSNNSYTVLATSNVFTVGGSSTGGSSTGGGVNLTSSPASISVGGTVTASWSGIANPSASDWIGLYVPGAANNSLIQWMYVSCSKSTGSPKASGSCPFAISASVAAGTYELRLFSNNSYTVLATSNVFTVGGSSTGGSSTGGGVNLTSSPASISVGGTVTASWSGIANPSASDWIGLYVPGAANTSLIQWMYVSCSKSTGSPKASGSCPFAISASVAAGTYQLRLFSNNSYTVLATSNVFTVGGASTASSSTGGGAVLTSSPTYISVGGTVTASWSGIANPSASDWIGLYVPGAANTSFIQWMYVSCSKSTGSPKASGSCPFAISASVAAGTYELRLLSNDGYTVLATSQYFGVGTGQN
jgi:hypothetical protein